MASNGVLSINESGLKNAKGILDNANTNLANARNQLTGITMPEKFSNSARLKTIPSSIQKVEKQVSGIQSYIDQKIKDFRKAEETAKNVANALGKSLAGLTTTAPSIIGSLSLQGRATNTSSKINFLIGGAKGIARAFETTAGILVAPTMYSTLLNLEIAASKGLVQLGENIADGALATLAEDASVLNWMFGSLIDKKQMEKMQKATMSFVSKDYTNNLYNYLNNNKLSKIINDFSLIKNDSNISNFVTNITNGGALFKVAEKAGPYGLIASATLGFLKGKGESTQAYWSQSDVKSMIDKGDNISNIFKKGTIYSDIKGLWSATSTAFQFATGAGGKVDNVLNKAWKRVIADSAAGGAEVYANAYAESVRTGKSYAEALKDIGGHEAVAKSAATSGAVSAIGELVRWGLGKNKVQNSNTTVNIPDNETGTAEVKYRIIPENDLTEGFNEQNHTLEVAKSMQRQYWKGYVSDEEIDNGFKKIHVYRDDDFEELEIIKKNPRVSAFCDDNGEVHIKESEVEKCPTSVLHENNHQNGTLKCDPDDVTINRAKDEAATEMFALDAVGDHSNGNSSYAHNVGILRRIKKNVDEKVHSIPGYEETDLLKLAYTDKNNASKDLFDQALDEIMEKEGFSKELNKNLEIGDGGYYYQYSFKEILDASKKLLDMAAEVEMKCSNIK